MILLFLREFYVTSYSVSDQGPFGVFDKTSRKGGIIILTLGIILFV